MGSLADSCAYMPIAPAVPKTSEVLNELKKITKKDKAKAEKVSQTDKTEGINSITDKGTMIDKRV